MGTETVPTFELLPAIDLRGGRVVRLREGDFARETQYSNDAVQVARLLVADGATWLHVVDLDGARAGEPRLLELVAAIVAAVDGQALVEVGGGLRTPGAVTEALGTGCQRVAVGTAALRDPEFVASMVARHGPSRIVGSIDVRDGVALGDAWRPGGEGMAAADAVTMLAGAGIQTFEVTAIDRDGMLGGPDLVLLRSLVALGRGRIIASGGVSSLADVLAVEAADCSGTIIGRAIYEGRVDLAQLTVALGSGRAAGGRR